MCVCVCLVCDQVLTSGPGVVFGQRAILCGCGLARTNLNAPRDSIFADLSVSCFFILIVHHRHYHSLFFIDQNN